jgi:transposase-like protein
MTSTTKNPYAGHRFPPELISYTVWLYFRFPLSLRMVEEMLAFRGIEVSHETIRQWGLKFGREFANIIQRRLPRPGDMSASHNRPERIGALRPRRARCTNALWIGILTRS